MKALSIKQPWASLIAGGFKTIELRSWQTGYRGRILIVSSRKPAFGLAGYALATATIEACVPMTREHEQASFCKYDRDAFAWVLGDIRRIAPFEVKGQQGLFEVEYEEPLVDKTDPGPVYIHRMLDEIAQSIDIVSDSTTIGMSDITALCDYILKIESQRNELQDAQVEYYRCPECQFPVAMTGCIVKVGLCSNCGAGVTESDMGEQVDPLVLLKELDTEKERILDLAKGKIDSSLKLILADFRDDKEAVIKLRSEFLPLVADHMLAWFRAEGGVNYVELSVMPSDREVYTLCMQKKSGLTPAEKNVELRRALEESVKLQSHYAGLLNQYDGGERLQFESIEAWMKRLDSLATAKVEIPDAPK
jgi:hypothetical protein